MHARVKLNDSRPIWSWQWSRKGLNVFLHSSPSLYETCEFFPAPLFWTSRVYIYLLSGQEMEGLLRGYLHHPVLQEPIQPGHAPGQGRWKWLLRRDLPVLKQALTGKTGCKSGRWIDVSYNWFMTQICPSWWVQNKVGNADKYYHVDQLLKCFHICVLTPDMHNYVELRNKLTMFWKLIKGS